MQQQTRPPVPPFDEETARQKVKAAQDAWNTRVPEKVSRLHAGLRVAQPRRVLRGPR
jgi:nuclear transport factor 2 (NTF2) superfamily protein